MSIVINKVYEVKTARKYEILVLVTNDDDDVCVCVCVCVYSVTQSCLTLCDSTDSIAFNVAWQLQTADGLYPQAQLYRQEARYDPPYGGDEQSGWRDKLHHRFDCLATGSGLA